MITFVKGIFFDQANRVSKMLDELTTWEINPEMDRPFLDKTIQLLEDLHHDIRSLISSGELDIEELSSYNVIRYNTFHERLQMIELFRFLVIINYGKPEAYFKKKIARIYKEINNLQKQPIITTISNSESYYWALPTYDIIAVPVGEEKNLLNLPDLYHEMGHLIYNQHEIYLKGMIESSINDFYNSEIRRVREEDRAPDLIPFCKDKNSRWLNGWIMEFTCDFIATYLVGPAYAWTNLKITTLSSGEDQVYVDSPSHPSDEARMRGIFYVLNQMGFTDEVKQMDKGWQQFLKTTNNPVPPNYSYVFPPVLIETLADNVIIGCKSIGLNSYVEQLAAFQQPISKLLNDAWFQILNNPEGFSKWEADRIQEITDSIQVATE